MSLKIRIIILSTCTVLFLTITPYILLYSIGYRIDLTEKKITTTGGVYVKVFPEDAEVIVDSKIKNKTGILSGAVFVQDLLPKQHTVLIKKDGYYDYQKNLSVKEKEVAKLENVILFKKEIKFDVLDDKSQFSLLKRNTPEKFIIKNNNLYYSDIPENSQLTKEQKSKALLKNIVAYEILNNSIMWLGADGFLKSSNPNGENTEQLSQTILKINPKQSYQLYALSQSIFLKEGDKLLLFDKETKSFKNFYDSVKEIKVSQDGQKMVYFNDYEIFVYYLEKNSVSEGQNKILLQKSDKKISDCYWLNSDYIIFSRADEIIISEIDTRGNINSINLPQTIFLSNGLSTETGKNIDIKKPNIFFDQSNRKLYILTGENLLASDRILP